MKELTLSILKPDAVKRNITGLINSYIEKSGLVIVAQKKMKLTREQTERFYAVHKDRSFFNDLVNFMISGPVVVQVLSGENSIANYRTLMGATNPQEADKGTIRGDFADNIDANCVHGSDSAESAKQEVSFFFAQYEITE